MEIIVNPLQDHCVYIYCAHVHVYLQLKIMQWSMKYVSNVEARGADFPREGKWLSDSTCEGEE